MVAGAFGLGVLAGWATGFIPQIVAAEPSASPSATPLPSITTDVEPVLPAMEPITRELTQADRDAGVTTTDITVKAEGTFSVVPGAGIPVDDAGDVRWVSVSVEDGVAVNADAFKNYVISTLNANRGWGTEHAVQFVATDGVADYRIVLASPYTAAVLCPDTHVVIPIVPETEEAEAEVAEADTPSATPATDTPWSCGDDGVVVISSYDWTAGFAAFAADYEGSRTYLINHRIGHLMGREDVICEGGRADIMVVQEAELPAGCEANPWPNPDAPADFVDPEAAATATPTPGAA